MRFEIVEPSQIKDKITDEEYEELTWGDEWGEPRQILWDRKHQEIAWSGSPEPEDATLNRDYYPLVALLNKVSEENASNNSR